MGHREDATITVMRYRYWHPETDSLVESEDFATSEAIHDGLGMPVNESARRVERTQIDQNGVLKPAPKERVERD
jgi:hypothetical protein